MTYGMGTNLGMNALGRRFRVQIDIEAIKTHYHTRSKLNVPVMFKSNAHGAETDPVNSSSSSLGFQAHGPVACINLPCPYSTLGWVLEGGKAPVGLQGVRRVDGRSLGRDLGNLEFVDR